MKWDEKLKCSSEVIDIKRWASLLGLFYLVSDNLIHNKLKFEYEQSKQSRKGKYLIGLKCKVEIICIGKEECNRITFKDLKSSLEEQAW